MSDGNSGEVGGNDESVDVLQKYDDKWYEHDGDETNYAVILQDESKKYYKQLGWVEKRLRDEYENQGVISGNTSTSRPDGEEPAEENNDTESTDSDTRKSVFPKFEPGNIGKNLLLTVFYGFVWPVGIVAMFYGFIRNYRYDEERVMGWGENLLTLWLGLIVAMVIIVGSLGAAGIIPEEAFSDDPSPAGSDTTEVSFSEWQQENSDRIEAAEIPWEDGEDKVVEAEEMEPSLVNSPIDLLEDAHESYDEAQTTFGALEDEALSNAEQHPEGSRQHELYTTAAEYYGNMESAALFRKTAISIILDNPDGDISQSEEDTFYARLEQSESHYEDAQAAKSELKDMLG